ncbi:segregation and condensation protein A [Mucilaginibacter psychrotolerans]|uniref:Segregation and condensation protein A n=1 Tax=Mucilaginibacter psychrotolerans TaxID=1524096 RepID=A0A4Y8S9R8_9SPHI|nr:segregation/condensation protein A [Mucilaginibacter psychrotolerans]TFF35728.1 chromosome segregation protein ScpA [Mucilaginibacter psychrotolerans]
MTDDSFAIRLPQFEGPFDLLLFFIERDELDIHDIPIAKITDDFLQYIHHMTVLNMELASEFIFIAATLMRIKAKMLLPRYNSGEEENELDTKEGLIRKLIEYKKFKELCEEIRPYEDERFKQEKRGNIKQDLEQVEKVSLPGEELSELNLYKLMVVYNRLMKQYLTRTETVTHTVVQYPYTIEKQKQAIQNLLQINKRLDFGSIAAGSENKVHFVYNFLAVLEMLQQEMIDIQIGLGFNNFWIAPRGEMLAPDGD